MGSDETTSFKSSTARPSIITTPRRLSPAKPATPTRDEQKRRNRQSLRTRPSELLEKQDAEPPLSLRSEPLPREPKMSLFNLFSRPKVERARGHVERSSPIPPLPSKDVNASRSELAAPVPSNMRSRSPSPLPPRPVTAASKSSRLKFMEAAPTPRERRPGSFNPPPLFQAYPQSVKDGILEASNVSAEVIHQKSKSKRTQGTQTPALDAMDDGTSETSQRTALRLAASGVAATGELPRKIFVLVTSGYLLQYSETGPSDRLPEKMLHLGKDSAAFASDLVPGKHFVLQVSQAVDSEGVVAAPTGSIFSKLGIRSAAAKRMMSSFLLVMPDSAEMGSWMTAIRREIENLGGKKISPDPVRPQTAKGVEEKTELKKVPSQSHRYQVARDPSKVSNVTSPTQETFDIPPTPKLPPEQENNFEVDKADADTNTIDGIDMEASKLEEEAKEPAARQRAESDAPSNDSSTAVSVEQQHLNNIRSSLSNSTRVSRNSQAGTFATTAGTSRTNSLSGSPPSSDLRNQESGPIIPGKSPRRALSAFNLNRRRSAVPAELRTSIDNTTSPAKNQHSVIAESPVIGLTSPTSSPRRRLSAMRSEPNLQTGLSNREKHDSKMPTPPIPSVDGERPESFVGDLPPPSAWSSNRTASRRISVLQQQRSPPPPPLTQPKPYQSPPAEYTSPRATEQDKSKRISFSMPLKVNPSSPGLAPLSSNNRRRSQLNDPDPAGDMPLVHTLSAKADNRISVSHVQYHRPLSPKSSEPPKSPARLPSVRLSHLPSQTSYNAFASSPEAPRRSSSATALASFAQAHAQAYGQQQPNGFKTLKRPTSMQIRSDSAPFLSSVRDSTGPGADIRTAPIRAMRPSRSSSNLAALANQPSPLEAFKALKFDTPTVAEEADTPTPLPVRAISPMPSRPGSRSSVRRSSLKPKSPLPELDLGIPVVGLGPPAPPPSAPLPAPPSSSRPTSPTPAYRGNAGIEAVAGLGIRVS